MASVGAAISYTAHSCGGPAVQTDGYVSVRTVRSTGESRRLRGEKVHYRSQFTQMMMEGREICGRGLQRFKKHRFRFRFLWRWNFHSSGRQLVHFPLFFVRSVTLHPQYAQLCVVCQSIGTLPVSYISARLYF